MLFLSPGSSSPRKIGAHCRRFFERQTSNSGSMKRSKRFSQALASFAPRYGTYGAEDGKKKSD
jgi:hypothetical protein